MTLRLLTLAAALAISGCVVAPPAGEVAYGPPDVYVEPPHSEFVFFPWPHYDVEHHYVIEDDHVHIRDRHYFPFYGRTHRYVRNDEGRHRGWFRHED